MDDDAALDIRHSFYSQPIPRFLPPNDDRCKSEIVNLRSLIDTATTSRTQHESSAPSDQSLGMYYMKYEHDEVPVKDSTSYICTRVRDKESLTSTALDNLEMAIFKNMSQELPTDNSSAASLESHIKFFKSTVQEIFDNFYTHMRDFEQYKKRFHEILAKGHMDAVADMEDFIKDMIQHIMSSETSMTSGGTHFESNSFNSKKTDQVLGHKEENHGKSGPSSSSNEDRSATYLSEEVVNQVNSESSSNGPPLVESYKNKEYDMAYCTSNSNKTSRTKRPFKKEDVLNIYLLSGNPYVQIKMNDRNLLSEINIKKPSREFEDGKYGASAENMTRVAAKKDELKKYVEQNHDDGPDIEIPVKVSYAKKNIHLNEDFSTDREEKSFISKLCSYLCRKFHKQ